MREYSTPALVDIPEAANLADVVFRRAADEPDAVIMRRKSGDGWQDVTARQFRDEVLPLAKGLIAAGIGPGERVALMSRTRYEWTLIDYAIWSAGAVTVPIYETSSAEQVEWIIGDSGARAVFAETAAHETTIASVRAQLPHLEMTWRIEDEGRTGAPLQAVSDRGAGVDDDQVEARRKGVGAKNTATIIYTSGTTGRPKGCELTHANLLADVRNATEGALTEVFDIGSGSTLLFLPLAHAFARIIQVGCLESGVVLGHTPSIKDLVPDLGSFQPTFILAVPRVFEKVFNTAQQQASESPVKTRIFKAATDTAIAYSQALDARSRGEDGPGTGLTLRHGLFDRLVYGKLRHAVGGRVQFAVSGGAALGERLGHFFRGVGITILEGYGMTELTAAATVNRPNRNKIGTVGLAIPGAAVRIAGDGEVLIRGAMAFPGYWHNEAATKETLDEEGWIHTGDIGSLDDEGFLRITGRKKELIVTAGGKNVSPAVLEDRLRAHALVSQCMVVGDNRPYVAALITIDEEMLPHWKQQHGKPADATVADLREDQDLLADVQQAVDDANKAVSRAEAIRRFRVLTIDFTEAGGQLTPSLKLRRAVVAKECAADIEALYS
ncbi:MAG TPA: long-chain fatty acid--CoA ligase [Streptosporangiaceae bacterium]|nr:long-chain fatty acid--CoA ligase [Streptosporangiaceae bacterium]